MTALVASLLGCADPPPATYTLPSTTLQASAVIDEATGFERWPDGSVNRAMEVPVDPADYDFPGNCGTRGTCGGVECNDGADGRCVIESCMSAWCICLYPCASDLDCGEDEACLRPDHGLRAGFPLPLCVPAGCRSNADCPSGECGVSVVPGPTSYSLALACRTATDECRTDQECDSMCSGGPLGWRCECSNCWCD